MPRTPRKIDNPNATLPHLLHRANQAANELVTRELSACGMTPRQFIVMLAVDLNPGLRQVELAKLTGIDRSTVGDVVARLAERGILKCSAATRDRRASEVTLTDAGRELLTACREGAATAERALLGRVPSANRSLVLAMLEALAGLDADAPPPATRPRRPRRKG